MDRKMTTQASLGIVVLFISFMITGCSGGGGGVGFVAPPAATYSVGGVVSGLTGTGLVLTNNGGDNLALSSNGTFTFPTGLSSNATYSVASVAQPGGKQCVVTSGTGTVGSANVTDVAVVCTVTDVTSGLAAEYQCDGNVNDSVGSANGTPSGGFAYTTDRYGNSSSACSFNGTDAKVHVAGAISAPGSTGFSLSLWTKTTNTTFTGSIVYGNFLFSIHGSMILTVIPGATMSTSMTYSQNTWAHVVGTYDDTTGLTKLYKDGALVSQATKSGAVGAASLTSFDLGQNAWPAASYWNGALDDVRYYGRTLSAAEVQQLYDYQKPASRKTFVTAAVFDGNLIAAEGTHKATGIVAADALCLKDADYPGTGVYKAFLVDAANRVASVSANAGDGQIRWVLRPNTTYYRSDGTTKIMTTNPKGLFAFGALTNAFDPAATDTYWTGMNSDWTTYPNTNGGADNQNCAGWSYNASTSSPYGTFGMGNQTDAHAISFSFNAFCSIKQYHLVCIEQ